MIVGIRPAVVASRPVPQVPSVGPRRLPGMAWRRPRHKQQASNLHDGWCSGMFSIASRRHGLKIGADVVVRILCPLAAGKIA